MTEVKSSAKPRNKYYRQGWMGKPEIQTVVVFLGWIYRDLDIKEKDIIEKRN